MRSLPIDPVANGACTTGVSVLVFTTAALALEANSNNYQGSGKKKEIAIGLAVGGFSVMVIILCIIYISRERTVLFVEKNKRDEFDVEAFIRNYGSLTPKRYTYANVKKMTDSFRDKIGKDGYGTVYKGRLLDGLLVAVKVLSESKGNGENFVNEVASIGRTSHVNIVTLSGFCYERDKRALIYEFMPNGSLDNFIHKHGSEMANFRLEWKTLSEIAVGIAQGLEYLHRGCNTRILHFDIKPQNRKKEGNCNRKRMVVFVKKDKRDEFDVEAFIRNYGSLTPKRLLDGLLVAVKVLSESKGNGEDFINEVASIGRTSHVNIVTLSGFCYKRDKRALIYEFMPNRSLDNFIHKHGSEMANFRLEWKTLSEIALGIA
ncbi:hypothetical protein CerSpe_116170 [Prunus speciosa]